MSTKGEDFFSPVIRNLIIVALLFFAWGLRGYNLSYRAALSADEAFMTQHTLTLKNYLFSGSVHSFVENFIDFYSRPTNYVLNLIPAIPGGLKGIYFGHAVYGMISLVFLYFLALKVFDDYYAALGTLALGAFSGVHIGYSMRITYIPCFLAAAASLYFFIQSHYGEHPTRDKVLAGILMGMSFTSHYAVGPLPFIYVIIEIVIYISEKNKRNGWMRRFLILLVSMAAPIIFWELICLFIMFVWKVTSPYFRHYMGEMISHSNLKIPEPISNFYFLSMPFYLESLFFPILVITGISGIFVKYFKFDKKQKTFVLMALLTTIFYALFTLLSCMSRLVFPLYIFFVPIGGFGFSLVYREFRKKGNKFSCLAIFGIMIFLVCHAFAANKTIKNQQKVPEETIKFLKENGISRIVVGMNTPLSLKSLPHSKRVGYTTEMWDDSGYKLKIYYTKNGSKDVVPIAEKNDIKYLLVQYADYALGPLDAPHRFMYLLHDMGLKRPYHVWGSGQNFPLSYFDKEPFKIEIYNDYYAKRIIPISAEEAASYTMLYDLTTIKGQGR